MRGILGVFEAIAATVGSVNTLQLQVTTSLARNFAIALDLSTLALVAAMAIRIQDPLRLINLTKRWRCSDSASPSLVSSAVEFRRQLSAFAKPKI